MLVGTWARTVAVLHGSYPTSLPFNLGSINHQIITQNLTLQIPLIHVCPTCGGLNTRSDLQGAAG